MRFSLSWNDLIKLGSGRYPVHKTVGQGLWPGYRSEGIFGQLDEQLSGWGVDKSSQGWLFN